MPENSLYMHVGVAVSTSSGGSLSIPDKNDFMKNNVMVGASVGPKGELYARLFNWMDCIRMILLLGLIGCLVLRCSGQAGTGQIPIPASDVRILLRSDTVQGQLRQQVMAVVHLGAVERVRGIHGSLRLEAAGEVDIYPIGWSTSFDTVVGDVRLQSLFPTAYRLPFDCHQRSAGSHRDSAYVAFDFFTQDNQPLSNAVVALDGIILVDLIEGKIPENQGEEVTQPSLMHPNPVQNSLSLELRGADEAIESIEVWDMSGRLLLRQDRSASLLVMDLQALLPGRYLLLGCSDGKVLRRWPFLKL